MTRDHASSSNRPLLIRSDTDALLSYYGSPLADQGVLDDAKPLQSRRERRRQPQSPASSSSSDYSDASSDSEYSIIEPDTPASTSRRALSKNTEAGDHRRLAIVPTHGMDVALVVPPDSAFKHQRSQSHAVEDVRPGLGPKRRSTGYSVQSIKTPEIGDGKSIEMPVAPPFVLGTFKAVDADSYMSYQPGVHATAGPLPPPPALDPRKKEQLDAVRQALQLPPSVEAALARRTPSPLQAAKSVHRREGAFSPSVDQASIPESEATSSTPSSPIPVIITPLIIQPPPRNTSLNDVTPHRKKRVSAELSISDDHSDSVVPPTPSPPPKSLRSSLTRGFRRMSISRSPSLASRTPSPPEQHHHFKLAQPPKIKALYPAAMYCPELHPPSHASKMTSLERCRIYTQKINELYVYDCGLGDWIMEAKLRSRSVTLNEGGPSLPSAAIFTPQPRNVSHGSEASEITFPTRPDAGVATDLSSPASSTVSSVLPYPALPPRTSSIAKSGFFSSLGRKGSASTARRGATPQPTQSPLSSSQSMPRAVLTKRPTMTPSVPGGPRPPGGWKRMSRSQTVSIPRNSESLSDTYSNDGHSAPRVTSPGPQEPSDPAFEAQLDKLTVLLPQADRHVLAGYLRRAGQDLVAIGLYLDDEKNGRLRKD